MSPVLEIISPAKIPCEGSSCARRSRIRPLPLRIHFFPPFLRARRHMILLRSEVKKIWPAAGLSIHFLSPSTNSTPSFFPLSFWLCISRMISRTSGENAFMKKREWSQRWYPSLFSSLRPGITSEDCCASSKCNRRVFSDDVQEKAKSGYRVLFACPYLSSFPFSSLIAFQWVRCSAGRDEPAKGWKTDRRSLLPPSPFPLSSPLLRLTFFLPPLFFFFFIRSLRRHGPTRRKSR